MNPLTAKLEGLSRRLAALLELEQRLGGLERSVRSSAQVLGAVEAQVQEFAARSSSVKEEIQAVRKELAAEAEKRDREIRNEYDGRVKGERVLVGRDDELRAEVKAQSSQLGEIRERLEWLVKWVETFRQELFLEVKLRLDDVDREKVSVVDRERYEAKLRSSPDGIKLNLGSASQSLPDHLNVDQRPVEGVDLQADVRELPFAEGQLAEIYASHLLEHFGDHEARKRLLPYWRSLLRPGGRLVLVLPDAESMMKRWAAGDYAWEDLREVTFGGQDYQGNTHFTMYTPESLERALVEAGFSRVERVATARRNGKCLEMELVGYR